MSEAAAPSGLRSGAGVARVLSDDRLAQRATRGDQRAFAAIYRRYHQSLYRFCLAIVGDSQDAQDALQNTMVKVLRALPGEKRQIQLKPWLYRIAHNEAVELLRRRRATVQLDPELPTPAAGPAEEAAQRERLRRLISDLGELPERQRGALVMRELAGLGFAEIGAALGTSPAAARQTVYEARLGLHRMDAGREMSCATVTRALSDDDGRVTRRRDIRAHLRTCPSCSRFRDELDSRRHDFAALAPLPAAAATGLLHGILGGHGGSSGGGLAGALGGGAGKALGASAVVKSAATVAVVAAIGVSAANRAGLVDVGLPGDGGTQATRTQPPSGAGQVAAPAPSSAAQRTRAGAGSAQGWAAAKGTVGASHPAAAAKGDSASLGQPAGANTGTTAAAPSPYGSSASQHGRGYGHQLPAAAAHGQQAAAGHKGAGHGASHAHHSHPAHPSKPPHAAHTSNPGSQAHGPPPPPSHGSTHEAQTPRRGIAPPPEAGTQP